MLRVVYAWHAWVCHNGLRLLHNLQITSEGDIWRMGDHESGSQLESARNHVKRKVFHCYLRVSSAELGVNATVGACRDPACLKVVFGRRHAYSWLDSMMLEYHKE